MKIEVLGNTLDKEQTASATISNRNNIIIAGAGSGKSLTMVGKIKYLVLEKNVNIKDILCITFTNNAAKSLENKIKKELNLDNTVYTFHKLALEILNDFQIKYKIAESDLLEYLIDEVLFSIGPEKYFEHYFLTKNYFSKKEFQSYKNTIARFIRLFIANYYEISYFDKLIKKAKRRDIPFLKIIKKIYEIYILEKEAQGLIDFDDMIYMATSIVKDKGTKNSYKYIIIDEYQDTSKVRENLVQEIIKKTNAFRFF